MDGTTQPIAYPTPAPPAEGEVIEIAQGLLWARMPLPMRLNHVNVYILDDGDGWTIVDTGLDTPRTREIWHALFEGPLKGKPLRRVIVTHHHPDHIGLAGWFQSTMGAELWCSRTAWLYARMLHLDVQGRPLPETLAFWQAAGMDPTIFAERAASRPVNYVDMIAPLPLGFHRLKQDDRITAGGRLWQVEIGHGHAPEQATLWGIDHDLVLAGDQILPGISPNLGVYASEPEADTVGEWLHSCARLAQIARPDHLALPGHQRPFTGVKARLDQLIHEQTTALDRLVTALEIPRTAADCFPFLYGREIGAGEYGLALVESVGHLNHLRALGRVDRHRRSDGAWLWHATS